MKPIVIALSFASALVLGCGGGARAKLVTAASNDLHCPPASIDTDEPASYAGHARGCGREMLYTWNRREWVSPLSRATFDLSCPADQITVLPIDSRTAGVSGCGKKATYVVPVNGYGLPVGGNWVMNSASAE